MDHNSHEIEKLQSAKSCNNSKSGVGRLKDVRWDVSFVDRLLFPGTTIIFGICVLISLLTRSLIALVGEVSAVCWSPPSFTDNWIEYTNRLCLTSTSLNVIRSSSEGFRNENDTALLNYDINRLFHLGSAISINSPDFGAYASPYYSPIYQLPTLLINLVLLTVVPTLAWRLLISVDGVGLLTLPSRSKQSGGMVRPGLYTTLWFMVTQLLMIIVSITIFVWLYLWASYGVSSELYSSDLLLPKQLTAFCDFSIKSFGNSQYDYTVQCVFSKIAAREVIEYGLYHLCLLWSLLMICAAILNGAIVFIFAILASCKSKVVAWYIGHEDNELESRLGWSDIFVCLLAGRCGDSLIVGRILQQAYSDMKQE